LPKTLLESLESLNGLFYTDRVEFSGLYDVK